MLASLTNLLKADCGVSRVAPPCETPNCFLVAAPDPTQLRSYVAGREARLARTWDRIASNLMCAGERAG
jgi:hypothetical protein